MKVGISNNISILSPYDTSPIPKSVFFSFLLDYKNIPSSTN